MEKYYFIKKVQRLLLQAKDLIKIIGEFRAEKNLCTFLSNIKTELLPVKDLKKTIVKFRAKNIVCTIV